MITQPRYQVLRYAKNLDGWILYASLDDFKTAKRIAEDVSRFLLLWTRVRDNDSGSIIFDSMVKEF